MDKTQYQTKAPNIIIGGKKGLLMEVLINLFFLFAKLSKLQWTIYDHDVKYTTDHSIR